MSSGELSTAWCLQLTICIGYVKFAKAYIFLKIIFIGVQLLYNIVLFSAAQQSESAICLHIPLFFGFPSRLGHHRALSKVPVLYSRFSLVIYVIHNILFMSQQCVYVNLNLPTHTPHSLFGIHMFVLYVCVLDSNSYIKCSYHTWNNLIKGYGKARKGSMGTRPFSIFSLHLAQ